MLLVNQVLILWLILISNIYYCDYEHASNSANTSLNFDIVMRDKVVGTLKATKHSKDGKVNYQSITAIKTRFITEIEVDYKYDVTFEEDIMQKARVVIDVNNKPHANTLTHWEKRKYQITKNDKKDAVIQKQINYSTILLFFKEPINVDCCYSEQDGSFNTIVSNGNNSYKKINSNGKENLYYYRNGLLEKASIDGGLVKFEIIAHH